MKYLDKWQISDIKAGCNEACLFADTPDEYIHEGFILSTEADKILDARCLEWITTNEKLIHAAIENNMESAQIGRDYYFDGAGHGVGFQDRDLPPKLAEALTKSCLYDLSDLYLYVVDGNEKAGELEISI